MYIRLKSAEIGWLTATVCKLRGGLQTLLLTARPGLTGGKAGSGAAEERSVLSQRWKMSPCNDTPILGENKLPAGRASWTELNSTRGGSLPSSISRYSWRAVFLKPLAAFPLLHFPPSHLVPHTNGALGIIIIPCALSLAFLLFSVFP